MKSLITMILFSAAVLLESQTPQRSGSQVQNQGTNLLQRLGLSTEEVDAIEEIVRMTNRKILPARAEVEVLQSDLTFLLSQREVDMREVERILRGSLEWELTIRMAQIEMQISVRNSIGVQKWTRLMQTVGTLRNSGNLEQLVDRASTDESTRRLLLILRNMLRF